MDDKNIKDTVEYIEKQKKLKKDKLKQGRLSQHTVIKEDRWSKGSKKKLKASMRHKMRRIYVGFLDALDAEKAKGSISAEAAARLRSKALNMGNDQIRNMEMELEERYNVEALNYHVDFKVLGKDRTNEGQ